MTQGRADETKPPIFVTLNRDDKSLVYSSLPSENQDPKTGWLVAWSPDRKYSVALTSSADANVTITFPGPYFALWLAPFFQRGIGRGTASIDGGPPITFSEPQVEQRALNALPGLTLDDIGCGNHTVVIKHIPKDQTRLSILYYTYFQPGTGPCSGRGDHDPHSKDYGVPQFNDNVHEQETVIQTPKARPRQGHEDQHKLPASSPSSGNALTAAVVAFGLTFAMIALALCLSLFVRRWRQRGEKSSGAHGDHLEGPQHGFKSRIERTYVTTARAIESRLGSKPVLTAASNSKDIAVGGTRHGESSSITPCRHSITNDDTITMSIDHQDPFRSTRSSYSSIPSLNASLQCWRDRDLDRRPMALQPQENPAETPRHEGGARRDKKTSSPSPSIDSTVVCLKISAHACSFVHPPPCSTSHLCGKVRTDASLTTSEWILQDTSIGGDSGCPYLSESNQGQQQGHPQAEGLHSSLGLVVSLMCDSNDKLRTGREKVLSNTSDAMPSQRGALDVDKDTACVGDTCIGEPSYHDASMGRKEAEEGGGPTLHDQIPSVRINDTEPSPLESDQILHPTLAKVKEQPVDESGNPRADGEPLPLSSATDVSRWQNLPLASQKGSRGLGRQNVRNSIPAMAVSVSTFDSRLGSDSSFEHDDVQASPFKPPRPPRSKCRNDKKLGPCWAGYVYDEEEERAMWRSPSMVQEMEEEEWIRSNDGTYDGLGERWQEVGEGTREGRRRRRRKRVSRILTADGNRKPRSSKDESFYSTTTRKMEEGGGGGTSLTNPTATSSVTGPGVSFYSPLNIDSGSLKGSISHTVVAQCTAPLAALGFRFGNEGEKRTDRLDNPGRSRRPGRSNSF
ncbi:hypothetical protein IE53DRAFT_133745 [Violaceomyces palustris]|uniref:Uncharacterized protein n=1 Tax=Violaceomyces palustris TaxID=1673888 RepID=A0ACD0NV17_9BASI|nr:hypothetical protein IE53DRAFT_133745 [Violaceomyces palustris]